MGDGIVNSRVLSCILMSLALLNTVSAADTEGGVNIEPDIDETIFSEISHTETTTDLDEWEITLTLNDEAFNNNTSFTLTTQICVNEGYCLPPEIATLASDDDKIFTSSVTTIDDHTYVNWKVKATYADDDNTTEKFPSTLYYKTWSDCWFNDNEWGGDNCPGDEEDDGFLPSIGIVFAASAVLLAAIIRHE